MTSTTQKQPLVLRMMMLSIFLPAIILPILSVYLVSQQIGFQDDTQNEFIANVSLKTCFIIIFAIIPACSGLLLLWKAAWRSMVFLLVTPMLLAILGLIYFEPIQRDPAPVPPEARKIEFRGYPGEDVYCNGVHLGTVPFELTAAELKTKVPEWTTPPEQKWFVGDKSLLFYTWQPWDGFIRERHEARQRIGGGDLEAILKYDLQSKYWWRFECQGATICSYEINNDQSFSSIDYDKLTSYGVRAYGQETPAEYPLLEIMTNCVGELNEQEKKDWAKLALKFKHWQWRYLLERKADQNNEYQDMLNMVAKAEYGLSETPTEQECAAALERIIKENLEDWYQNLYTKENFSRTYLPWGEKVISSNFFDYSVRAIDQMGEAGTKPALRLLRENWYQYESRVYPLLYLAQKSNDPALFDELVRYYATATVDTQAITQNKNEKLVPLFKTMLNQIHLGYIQRNEQEARIQSLAEFGNPMLKSIIFEETAQFLTDYKNYSVEKNLAEFLNKRLGYGDDREELLHWVESLKLQANADQIKEMARDLIRGTKIPVVPSLGEKLFYDTKYRDLTERKILDWMTEHPNKPLEDFFAEYDKQMNDLAKKIKIATLQILFFEHSDDTAEILTKVWANESQREDFLFALKQQFIAETYQPTKWTPEQKFELNNNNQSQKVKPPIEMPAARSFVLPGFTYPMGEQANVEKSIDPLSPALYSILAEVNDTELCLHIARRLGKENATENTAAAIPVLEQWSGSDNERLIKAASESLARITYQKKIREESKQLFRELAAGKIKPDDLVPPTAPWVWQDGKYVQKETP